MSDFKNIVEFFRLNRRFEEAEKRYSKNNEITLTILETKEDYVVNIQGYNGLKLLRDIFKHFSTTEIYILNGSLGKEFYVKTNAGTYFNIATEQLNTNIALADLYVVPLEDFPFEIFFYDSVRNCVVIDATLIKDVRVFPESIQYDPNSDLLADFDQVETLNYSYKTHKTWVYDFVSFFIPNNDPEGDPFAKQVSDSDVTVTQTRITELISIIPIIRESIGKYYANYNVYKKDDGKIIPFYLNRNNFSNDSTSVVSLTFNSLGAFMTYLNDTIFSQTDNFTFGKRPAFIDQYKEIVILPLIRNLESKSTFSYYDALQALYYLPESLFYMLPEGFLWKFFDKAIANDSFTNKPYSKEEDIFLKILKVLVSTDQNAVKFIERLNKRVSEKDPQMLLEFFNSRIDGNNFIEFADIVNKAWRKTRFVDYSLKTNPEFASTNGPKLLPYHSEKLAGFFFSNVSASFENNPNDKKERFLRFKFETGKTKKVTKAHPKAVIYQDDEEIIEYYDYHPFYPVKIKNADEDNQDQETAIKLDAIVPAFMLFANSNQQFWRNVIKSGEYALDVAVIAGSYGTLSGIAAGEIIGTLAVARGMGAAASLTSSVANIVLKLANAEDSVLGQAFCEYLFWIEMLSLSGELTIAIRNGLKRSARKLVEKEEDFTKLKQQLDEAVAKDGNEVRKLTSTEKETVLDDIFDDAELRQSITPEGNKSPKKTRRSKKSKAGFDEVKELRKKNIERYEEFLSTYTKINSIDEILLKDLIKFIKGFTPHMDEVATLLEEGKIIISHLDDNDFYSTYKRLANKSNINWKNNIHKVEAFAYGEIMYFKNSSSVPDFLTCLSHESSHAIDYLKKMSVFKETGSREISIESIGNIWEQESRAYGHEMNWQKNTGQELTFKTEGEKMKHIKSEYKN